MKWLLNPEEREDISDLVTSHEWPALQKAIKQLVGRQEQALLAFDCSHEGADRQLLQAKLRVEGAKRLATDIEQLGELIKKENMPKRETAGPARKTNETTPADRLTRVTGGGKYGSRRPKQSASR